MTNNYQLLPFKFTRLKDKEILVNEVGDYIIVPYGTVCQIVQKQIDKTSCLYRELLSKFIICDDYNHYMLNVLATRLRTKKAFINNFTALHIFVLTIRCNQKCVYCQASSQDYRRQIHDMSTEDLSDAIDLMLQSPNPSITMEFQGGESSLVPELIEYAIKETEERNAQIGKDIRYVICTNIMRVSDKLLELLVRYNVYISTSLDGPDFIHDNNRGIDRCFLNFKQSLAKIVNVVGINKVSPLMTTSNLSLNYPHEIIDTYRELGFNSIFLRPLNPYGRAKNNDWTAYNNSFIDFYKEALDYVISLNLRGEIFVEQFTLLIMKKILTPFSTGFVDLQTPAGIINSVIVYNYDGYVYCSDESRMMAENGDYTFRLGKVSDNYKDLFYGRKAQDLSKVWATEYIAGCSDCAFQQYCGADPVRNYSTQGDWYGHRPSSYFCKFHKAVFFHLFNLIDKRGEEVIPIFRKWIYES